MCSTSMLDHWLHGRQWTSSLLECLRDNHPVGHNCPSDFEKHQSILKNAVWDKCNQETSSCTKDVLSFPDARISSGTVPVNLFSRNRTNSVKSVTDKIRYHEKVKNNVLVCAYGRQMSVYLRRFGKLATSVGMLPLSAFSPKSNVTSICERAR